MLHLAHHQICCYCLVVVESGVYVRTFFVSQEVSSSPHGVVRMIRPNKVFHFLTTAAATQPIFQNAIITRLPNRVKIWWHWPQTRCSYFSKKIMFLSADRRRQLARESICIGSVSSDYLLGSLTA